MSVTINPLLIDDDGSVRPLKLRLEFSILQCQLLLYTTLKWQHYILQLNCFSHFQFETYSKA